MRERSRHRPPDLLVVPSMVSFRAGDMPASGDKEVATGRGEDTRFADVAIFSAERRGTIEIVPTR